VVAAAALTRREALDKQNAARQDAREEAGGPRNGDTSVAIYLGDDSRRLVPLALVQVLSTLIDELEDAPDAKRAHLRAIRSQLCKLYRIEDPQGRASEVDVAQALAEEDGIPLED